MSSLSSVSNLTGLNSSGISFNGLASGLDTNQLIQALLSVQQAQITNLQAKQAQVVAQQSAFQTIQSRLSDFQNQSDKLAQALNSPLAAKKVTSSDSTLVSAAVTASAT